jgi:hypothetical protein
MSTMGNGCVAMLGQLLHKDLVLYPAYGVFTQKDYWPHTMFQHFEVSCGIYCVLQKVRVNKCGCCDVTTLLPLEGPWPFAHSSQTFRCPVMSAVLIHEPTKVEHCLAAL